MIYTGTTNSAPPLTGSSETSVTSADERSSDAEDGAQVKNKPKTAGRIKKTSTYGWNCSSVQSKSRFFFTRSAREQQTWITCRRIIISITWCTFGLQLEEHKGRGMALVKMKPQVVRGSQAQVLQRQYLAHDHPVSVVSMCTSDSREVQSQVRSLEEPLHGRGHRLMRLLAEQLWV